MTTTVQTMMKVGTVQRPDAACVYQVLMLPLTKAFAIGRGPRAPAEATGAR